MIELATPAPVLPTNLRTVDEFEQWQRQYAHEGSYEFVRGRIIEKKEMKQAEYLILKFLTRLFVTTYAYEQGDELTPEMDSYIDDTRKRRPDLAYFTLAQILETGEGIRQRTQFAIEILSESESFQDVTEKVQDYFDAGAVLVWYILPVSQKIVVYTSADESKAYKGDALVSASPLLPDFQFTVSDLFA
ncbi:Uma2 family endonuclease [Spirosoma oryzae]|uniref:Uma2 family endonuclease n=1 Tax=Spirosoma oryzae TaxID=1469603 RepID=A0A2T0TIG4_9BACT|nr:Uma2 family endonuclease [Spirosoma oryzae]PRY45368.1 Uma2 family endonuclease [Spirosoma oryzae]